jgi:hypothetical protein
MLAPGSAIGLPAASILSEVGHIYGRPLFAGIDGGKALSPVAELRTDQPLVVARVKMSSALNDAARLRLRWRLWWDSRQWVIKRKKISVAQRPQE